MPKNKHTTTKNTASNTKPSVNKPRKVHTFVPFVVFALALIVETCLIFSNGTGVAGKALHSLFTGLFGGVAYLIPAGAITIAYLYFDMNKKSTTGYKIVMLSIFVLFFAAANSILAFEGIVENRFSASISWNGGKAGQGGGFFGGLVGKLLSSLFGRIFGAIVAILVTLLSLSFFIGSAFPGVWGMIFSHKNKGEVKAQEQKTSQTRGNSYDQNTVPTPKFTPTQTQPPKFTPPTQPSRFDYSQPRETNTTYVPTSEPRFVPNNTWEPPKFSASDFDEPKPAPKRTVVQDYPVDIPKVTPPPRKMPKSTMTDPFSYGDVFLENMKNTASEETAYQQPTYQQPTYQQPKQTAQPTEAPKPASKPTYYSYSNVKSSNSRAYSPFANPFVSMEDVFGDGNGNSGGNGTQTRPAPKKSMAYSPFGNPFADIDESLKEKRAKDTRSQAYIAYESTIDPSERRQSAPAYDPFADDPNDVYSTERTASNSGFTHTAETNPPADGVSFTPRFSEEAESVSPNREVKQEERTAEITEINETNETDTPSVLTPFDFNTMTPLGGFEKVAEEPIAPVYGGYSEEPTKPVYDDYSEDTDTDAEEYEDEDAEDELDVVSSTDNVRVARAVPEREIPTPRPVQPRYDDYDEEEESRCVTPRSERRYPHYAFPEFGLLDPQMQTGGVSDEDILEVKNKLLGKLASFRVEASLSGYSVGPTVTRYELTPGPGVKVKSITSLIEDIALELQSDGVRIATVPGKSVIGVEVPNKKVTVVSLRSLIENREFINAKSKITVCVGLTVTGKPVYMDIDDMPHVLIAGQTKAGKSVAINCMLLSLLYRATPDEVQLILIDPKRVELNIYSRLPHLVMPVIDDPQRAAAALNWAVAEMERRYALLDKYGVRNREEYYELKAENPSLELMPQIVIVVDELADLMLQVREHVESLINRLAAMARACGIHLLIGTQRPSVDIITGLIKANIPARISFKVSSSADSRIILGNIGAEKLLGRGDMLYQATGCGRVRVQGAFVTSSEIKRITKYIIDNNGEAQFDPEIMRHLDSEVDKMNKDKRKGGGLSSYGDGDDDDGIVDTSEVDFDYLCRAIEYAIETDRVATNNIQRHLRIGFNRAADIVDRMEELGFISPRNGSKPREVLVTWEKYEQWKYNRMP